MIVQLCEYTKTRWSVYFNRVNFMVWELYLNLKIFKKSRTGRSGRPGQYPPLWLTNAGAGPVPGALGVGTRKAVGWDLSMVTSESQKVRAGTVLLSPASSFFFKIGTWANNCCQSSLFFFLLYLPKSPLVHRLYILVAGPSSCAMWDTASTWPDEQCHVHTQDPNRWNPGSPQRSAWT